MLEFGSCNQQWHDSHCFESVWKYISDEVWIHEAVHVVFGLKVQDLRAARQAHALLASTKCKIDQNRTSWAKVFCLVSDLEANVGQTVIIGAVCLTRSVQETDCNHQAHHPKRRKNWPLAPLSPCNNVGVYPLSHWAHGYSVSANIFRPANCWPRTKVLQAWRYLCPLQPGIHHRKDHSQRCWRWCPTRPPAEVSQEYLRFCCSVKYWKENEPIKYVWICLDILGDYFTSPPNFPRGTAVTCTSTHARVGSRV